MKTQLISVKRTLGVACLAWLILSLAVYGQTQPQRPATTSAPKTSSGSGSGPSGGRVSRDVIMLQDDDYILASSDVIEVIVEDAQELSVNYQINSSGTIPLRFLGSTEVAGKTTDEVSRLIADGLRGRYLKDPKVYVTVKQYNSRTFFIHGSVKQPGLFVIAGKPSLFKLITIAGGLMENHGATAYIFREVKAKPEKLEMGGQNNVTGENNRVREIVNNAKGTDQNSVIEGEPDYEVITANIGGILRGRLDHNIIIQPSDVVYVPPADVFYIAGEVRAPGQFQIRQGITLRQAISLAGGTLFKAKLDKGVIFRTDPTTGNFTEVPIDIGAVMKGEKQDVPILGNDVIWVPNSALRSFGSTVLQTLIPTAIYRLPIGVR
ncbi:MAG: polysaccharide biosynthesis/export family protein [Blastocatellales bacterium]